jgi:hypothetical protein
VVGKVQWHSKFSEIVNILVWLNEV